MCISMGHPVVYGQPASGHMSKKDDSPFPSCHELLTALQPAVGPWKPLPPPSRMLTWSCTGNHGHYESKSIMAYNVQRQHFMMLFLSSCSYVLSSFSWMMFPVGSDSEAPSIKWIRCFGSLATWWDKPLISWSESKEKKGRLGSHTPVSRAGSRDLPPGSTTERPHPFPEAPPWNQAVSTCA